MTNAKEVVNRICIALRGGARIWYRVDVASPLSTSAQRITEARWLSDYRAEVKTADNEWHPLTASGQLFFEAAHAVLPAVREAVLQIVDDVHWELYERARENMTGVSEDQANSERLQFADEVVARVARILYPWTH